MVRHFLNDKIYAMNDQIFTAVYAALTNNSAMLDLAMMHNI